MYKGASRSLNRFGMFVFDNPMIGRLAMNEKQDWKALRKSINRLRRKGLIIAPKPQPNVTIHRGRTEEIRLACGVHFGVRANGENNYCHKCTVLKPIKPMKYRDICESGRAPSKSDVKGRAKRAIDLWDSR